MTINTVCNNNYDKIYVDKLIDVIIWKSIYSDQTQTIYFLYFFHELNNIATLFYNFCIATPLSAG